MKLIMSPPSPYVRKVRVMVRELGLDHHVEEVSVATTPMEPAAEALAANPTGKIPSLIRDDGPALYDSRVICRYLDAHVSGGLYPESRLWEILTLEATADAILDAAVGMVYQARFVGTDGKSADWLDAQWGKVIGAVKAIEDRWMSNLQGRLDAAQIAVGCALGYLDLRHDARGWRATGPHLATWYEAFSERPSMQSTAPN